MVARIVVPVAFYLTLAVLYLVLSGAPAEVHALALTALAVGFLLPALVAGPVALARQRVGRCVAFMVLGIATHDGLAHLLITKVEGPFYTLRHFPWAYVLGVVLLSALVLCSAAILSLCDNLRAASSAVDAA
jgi:hypothetical protein